jgi:hypothetical protein
MTNLAGVSVTVKIVGILIFWSIWFLPYGARAESASTLARVDHVMPESPAQIHRSSDQRPDGTPVCDLFGNTVFDEEDNLDSDLIDTGHVLVSRAMIGGDDFTRLNLRRSHVGSHPPQISPLRC